MIDIAVAAAGFYLNVAVLTAAVYLGLRLLEQQYDAMDR